MKQLTCEMCGSADLVKQDGVFICQSCGTKYSVEEARKMMVEGVVEVSGTVKIDNSEKINKMLVNAKRAFSDKKYDQAQMLCSNILNEAPNNAEAILYEGLSIGWQGNTVKYTMDKAGNAAERALKIAYEQKQGNEEFEKFMMDALINIGQLGHTLILLCSKTIQKTSDDFKSELAELERELRRAGIYSDFEGLKRRSENLYKQTKNRIEELQKTSDNTLLIVISVYESAVNMISHVDNYSLFVYNTMNECYHLLENLAFDKIVINKYKSIEEKISGLISTKKRKAIEEYWKAHRSEKKALDGEKKSLINEKKKLEAAINSGNIKIADVEANKNLKVPAENEQDSLREEIDKLIAAKNKLGLLKWKEKKEIDIQIDEKKKIIADLESVVTAQKNNQQSECNIKIKEINKQIKPDKDRLINIQKRLNEINKELTKER